MTEWRVEYRDIDKVVQPMVEAGLLSRAERIRANAQRIIRAEGRVDTGTLMNSIEVTRMGRNTFGVGSRLPYAIYQHEGVREVKPVRAKVLAFKPRGSRTFVFARRTKGFRGIHFLTRAMREG